MNKLEPCECEHVLAKHDDNGRCRVKTCYCLKFEAIFYRVAQTETVYVSDQIVGVR